MTSVRVLGGAAILLTSVALLPGCATSRQGPGADIINLGRNSANEPCTATRTWADPAVPDSFASAHFITCRNVVASRPLGAIRVVADTPAGMKPLEKVFNCGEGRPVKVAGVAGNVRQCIDAVLGTEVVRIDLPMGDKRVVAAAAPALLGPLEEGIAIIAAGRSANDDPGRTTTATIDVASLPALPTGAKSSVVGTAFDPAVALVKGIDLNHKGLHVEASRVLNDALSRLPAATDPAVRAEFLLESALADSNISFAESAQEHFGQADLIMEQSPSAQTPFLRRKRDAYRSLDLLNRRQFRQALASLDRLISREAVSDQPLMDIALVRRLNQTSGGRDAVSAISLPDTAELSQVVLDAQANWARSVALFALGDVPAASTALDASSESYRTLLGERIDQGQVYWLGARIERQRGRIAAYRKDWSTALASFDRALDFLRRGAVATAGTGNEPAIAEAELERAGVFDASGADREAVRNQYAVAVDALVAANTTGSALPSGIDGYMDILVGEATKGARPDTFERFFRAMQAAGEPAVARQLSQLQNVVTADPELGSKVRDRTEIEREITRLRYAIATAGETPGVSVDDLENQRQAAESKLLAIDASLSANERFRSVDDRPATVSELRAALQPGEAYLKVVQLNQRAYGLFVSHDQTYIYKIAGNGRDLAAFDKLGTAVRASVDGQLANGKLVPFDIGGSHVLFRLIAGPAQDALLQVKALVVDPAGPLEKLPIGALVTAYDPRAPRPDPFDFSQTEFLAKRMAVSTAISPRSFLVARSLPGSTAAHPFLGLGEHKAPVLNAVADHNVGVGFGCSVPYTGLAALSRSFAPISKRELEVAATALGAPGSPMITDAAFSDTALEGRTDLADYQVLHFATHGLEEGQWGCAKSPPALVTSFGDMGSDGLLSFSEIAALRLNANLVVLSACDTASGVKDEALARASGQEEAGSTLEGLVRAFLTANARAVLATYWQVSAEQESEDFIRAFYSAARNGSIGTALRDAQVSLMKQPQFSHPFYWAPYFVVGDSTKSMLSNSSKS